MANSSDNFFSETARLKLEDGKEYRKKLHEEAGRILSSMLDVLPSVYNATVPSTEYAKHLKRVSLELARLKIEALNVGQDASLENLRPEYLYQKFGYQIRVGDTFFPTTNFSDEDYRNFLKAVVLVLLNGSSRENIRKALRIFTGYPVEVSDTTSGKGSIEKRYVTQFKNGIILIEGGVENISNLRISSLSGDTLYKEDIDYYIIDTDYQQRVSIKTINNSSLSDSSKVLINYTYNDAIVDQFKLKAVFDIDEAGEEFDVSDLILKSQFLLKLIKPAHVVPDLRTYAFDDLKKSPESLSTLVAETPLILGNDRIKEQRFISNEYDDFRKFTRNVEDTRVIEFNTLGHVFNKVSQNYDDVGYYLNEPDPLFKKQYQLFQFKGYAAQSSSLFNSPYTLELNEEQISIFNNSTYFDQSKNNREIYFPEIKPDEEIPIKDSYVSGSSLKVSALPIDFGVEVASGTLYCYQNGKIVNFTSPQSVILPNEAKGNRVYIYIDVSGSNPILEFYISLYGTLEVEVENIPLAFIDLPEDASVIWDSYITDLREHFFVNLTLRGDSSGFSNFTKSKGIVLGAGTRPIQYKFNDDQTKRIYKYSSLNELNNEAFSLNTGTVLSSLFTLNQDTVGYTADDLNFLFADLSADIYTSASGSLAYPIKEGPFALGLFFGPESPDDKVRIFDEDTMCIFNDTLERAERLSIPDIGSSYVLSFSGIIYESMAVYRGGDGLLLENGVDYLIDTESGELSIPEGSVLQNDDFILFYFYQTFGTELNRDLFYGRNTTYSTSRLDLSNEESFEGTTEEQPSIHITTRPDDFIGIQVDGILFNQATVLTGSQLNFYFDENSEIILNDPDHTLNYDPAEEYLPVLYFEESSSSLLNVSNLGPIEQLALESVSIIDQATGLPVIAENGLPVQ